MTDVFQLGQTMLSRSKQYIKEYTVHHEHILLISCEKKW